MRDGFSDCAEANCGSAIASSIALRAAELEEFRSRDISRALTELRVAGKPSRALGAPGSLPPLGLVWAGPFCVLQVANSILQARRIL